MGNLTPRGWQIDALREFESKESFSFLLDACPGAGKTAFSALCAKHLMDAGEIDFSVIVVPTTALKGDGSGGFVCDWYKAGIDIKTVMRDGSGVPKQFAGVTVTYQQLPNLVSTFEVWKRNGHRLFFVFDEVHHASKMNKWGAAAEKCARLAHRVLGMTGTLFRGDNQKISFVEYDDDDVSISDASYDYRTAVRERICRPVEFIKDDSMTQYILDGELNEVMVSNANGANESAVNATLYNKDSEWMQAVIANADTKLDEYRVNDIDAGGIVICRPGNDDNDDRHLEQVAKLVNKVTGSDPIVITHDDPDANAKISQFRKSSDRWICAVRKISEGVDIKRLRVMVMATAPQTELLFRQLTGRVVRWEDKNVTENATIYISSLPRLVEFAGRIESEAVAGLNEQTPRDREPRERERGESDFMAIDASHHADGAISHWGEGFSRKEIDAADRLKSGDSQLVDVSVTKVAHILKKAGVDTSFLYGDSNGEPAVVKRKRLREKINKRVRKLALVRNPTQPDFRKAWGLLFKQFGVSSSEQLFDDCEIDLMESLLDHLNYLIQKEGS